MRRKNLIISVRLLLLTFSFIISLVILLKSSGNSDAKIKLNHKHNAEINIKSASNIFPNIFDSKIQKMEPATSYYLEIKPEQLEKYINYSVLWQKCIHLTQ